MVSSLQIALNTAPSFEKSRSPVSARGSSAVALEKGFFSEDGFSLFTVRTDFFHPQSRAQRNAEAAFLLPFTALCILVIISFAALAVDLSRLSGENTEKHATADLAALGALEAYYNPTVVNSALTAPTLLQRKQSAVARAKQIAGLNFSTAVNRSPHVASSETLAASESEALSQDRPGYIRIGRWWTSSNEWGTSQPCGTIPCFQDWQDTDTWAATSVAVGLRVKNSSPVKNFFAGVFGSNSRFATTSAGGISAADIGTAIASVSSRHTVLLFDLGRSTTIDNRSIPERNGTFTAESTIPSNAQPANLILDALYEFIRLYRPSGDYNVSSSLPNDQLAWIGFDDRTDRGGYRNGGFVFPNSTSLEAFETALNPANSSSRGTVGLLPLPPSSSTQQSASNAAAALSAAMTLLTSHPRFNQVQNNVVLFTNGVSGCGPTATGAALGCPIFFRGNPSPNYDIEMTQYIQHNLAVRAAADFVRSNYVPRGITLDTLFFGQESSAHILLRQSPTQPNCMTEKEFRQQSLRSMAAPTNSSQESAYQAEQLARWLDIGDLTPAVYSSPRRYAFAANIYYDLARSIRGGWLPVLPPCNVPITCGTGNANITSLPSGLNPNYFENGKLFCNMEQLTERQLVRDFFQKNPLAPALRLVQY